jgi:hypothetical protein
VVVHFADQILKIFCRRSKLSKYLAEGQNGQFAENTNSLE